MRSYIQPGRADSGLTLVEALVALTISSFALLALGNFTWFVVARHERLSAAGADVQEASAFSQTMTRLIEGADPRSVRLSLTTLSLSTIGLPQSVAADAIRTVQLNVEADRTRKQFSMGMSGSQPISVTDVEGRRQPLLTMLMRFSVTVRTQGIWTESWQGEGPAPDRIKFTWQRAGGPQRTQSFLFGKRPPSVACLRDTYRVDCVEAP